MSRALLNSVPLSSCFETLNVRAFKKIATNCALPQINLILIQRDDLRLSIHVSGPVVGAGSSCVFATGSKLLLNFRRKNSDYGMQQWKVMKNGCIF